MRKALEQISKDFLIRTNEDWYNVSRAAFNEMGLLTLMDKYGSVYNLVKEFIPNFEWDKEKFTLRNQQGMQTQIETIFESQDKR